MNVKDVGRVLRAPVAMFAATAMLATPMLGCGNRAEGTVQPKVTDRRPTPWWRRWVAPAALVLGGIVIAENAMAIDATAPRWVDGVSSFAMAMLFLGLGLAVVAGER